ncbi:MAG: CBS domain-containing protein [Arenicellales bacterium]
MKVNRYMSESPMTIRSDADYRQGFDIMHDRNLHHLPVVDKEDKVVGVLTQRDLQLAARHYLEAEVEVSEVMHTPVVTVGPDDLLVSAARLMTANRIGGLPVVKEGRVVGVLTETDLFRALIDLLEQD